MKYIVQIMAMVSDIVIGAACISMIYYTITHPSVFMIILSLFLLGATYNTWKEQGGFIAWTRKGRKNFSKNWDDIMRTKNDRTDVN